MTFLYPERNKAVTYWLLSGCMLVFCMVIIGGITRLTHSGLSIVEWNPLMGTLPPLNEQEWQEAFAQYKLFPEYQQVHSHFSLRDFKGIFWWEYVHRLLGRIIGLVFLIPFLYFWKSGQISRNLMPGLLLLFALGALQGFLGWFMVKSGLADKPYVSHYRLAIHLFIAFITFGFTFWLALKTGFTKSQKNQLLPKRFLTLLTVFIATLCVQVVYGALVAGLKAGYAFNTFPKMGTGWIPNNLFALEPWYLNFIEGQAGVQFIHRCLAYLLLALAFALYWQSRKLKLNRIQRAGVAALGIALLLQALAGILTLVLYVPVPLAVLHQAGAFLLFSVSLFLLFHLKTGSKNQVLNKKVKSPAETPPPLQVV